MMMIRQRMMTFDIRHFWFLAARWKMRVAWGEALINHIIIVIIIIIIITVVVIINEVGFVMQALEELMLLLSTSASLSASASASAPLLFYLSMWHRTLMGSCYCNLLHSLGWSWCSVSAMTFAQNDMTQTFLTDQAGSEGEFIQQNWNWELVLTL